MLLLAADLDNTIIHSYKKASETDICVETKDGKPLSYMTPKAYQKLHQINDRKDIDFMPLTTRSLEQYRRIDFFNGKPPEMALAANGGILLINGVVDEEWLAGSKELIKDCYPEFEKGIKYFENDEYVYFDIRIVDELFTFTKSAAPLTTKAVLEDVLDLSKVSVYNIGDKVYIFPDVLTKGNSLERLRKRFDYEMIICAGDSEFDISMLNASDKALCPSSLSEFIDRKKRVVFDTEKKNFAEQLLEYTENILNERQESMI